jgi:hypothetical protein
MLKSKEEFDQDFQDGNWIHISYNRNRVTLHDGDYPHLSTPVTKLLDGEDGPRKRVILGFNFFSEAVGECCTRAPEHSEAFNRTVKLYQVSIIL